MLTAKNVTVESDYRTVEQIVEEANEIWGKVNAKVPFSIIHSQHATFHGIFPYVVRFMVVARTYNEADFRRYLSQRKHPQTTEEFLRDQVDYAAMYIKGSTKEELYAMAKEENDQIKSRITTQEKMRSLGMDLSEYSC